MFSFVLQIEINTFLANNKIGELYIIGWSNADSSSVVMAQIATKSRPNLIAFVNLENYNYVEPDILSDRAQRYQNFDIVNRFKY